MRYILIFNLSHYSLNYNNYMNIVERQKRSRTFYIFKGPKIIMYKLKCIHYNFDMHVLKHQ